MGPLLSAVPPHHSSSAAGDSVAKANLPYYPALDGVRVLCVLAMMLYHADLPWVPGGFLGVEVFFVISELITSLLRNELAATSRINLWRFWGRRARRLLPALWSLLWVVSVRRTLALPEEVSHCPGRCSPVLPTCRTGTSCSAEASYFEQVGRVSLLRHLWSLAIEEQFYAFWPLLFIGLTKRLSLRHTSFVVLALAFASSAWMKAARYVPAANPSALYFDSFARAAAMLLGATLALWWRPAEATPAQARGVELLGILGLAGFLLACAGLSEADGLLFRGGLLAIDGCALAR